MSTITYLEPAIVVSLLPEAGDPVWDAVAEEWTLTDTDGISYFGDTPSQCIVQFHRALHTIADHYRKCRTDAELPRYCAQQA